jgi:hypothetical protein
MTILSLVSLSFCSAWRLRDVVVVVCNFKSMHNSTLLADCRTRVPGGLRSLIRFLLTGHRVTQYWKSNLRPVVQDDWTERGCGERLILVRRERVQRRSAAAVTIFRTLRPCLIFLRLKLGQVN